MKQAIKIIGLIFLFQSCAHYKTSVSEDHQNWESKTPDTEISIEHTVYLIGDAGYGDVGELPPALTLLEKKLKTASENSTTIFLGDNIYPGGLVPNASARQYENAQYRLNVQLDILKEYKGRPVFIPGNHDWADFGLAGVKAQEEAIERKLNVWRGKDPEDDDDWENYFLPDDGCGGPEVIEVNKNLAIVIIDSQWYLEDWDKESEINDGCEAKSRINFDFLFEEMLRKNRNKNVIVAMHHPMYTNGPHGGYYTPKEHLFPLTQIYPKAYIPLPVLGSVAAFLRGTIGTRTDVAHPDYKAMKKKILGAAKKNGHFIFAAGHDHNMQYIELEEQQFIVSGAGSKTAPARLGPGTEFVYANKKGYGFSQIDFYEDGSAWIQFWAIDALHPEGKVLYRKKIKDELPIAVAKGFDDFPEYDQKKDSVTVHLLSKNVKKKGFFHNAMLGAHYRDLYRYQYKLPVLDLSEFRGGMTPLKRGGGNQTNSLRLADSEKNQYVMRSMEKDASRFIPYPFNKVSAASALVEDNFMSTHPFAAFVVPGLAEAAGIYHTNPRLYYIPKQPALEAENDVFGGGVYLVEERPAKDRSDLASFGFSKKIVSTPDVIKKRLKNHKHIIDENFTARSRLFDLVIGDWDRHDDQWRWASFKKDGKTLYRPIPRDRDQPFAKYDGIITKFVSLTVPFLKQLKVFGPEYGNIKWMTYGARKFDRTFLNELTWEEWQAEVKYIQEHLTDDAIDKAFQTWPERAYEESGKTLAGYTKKRRDNLMDIAREHYLVLAKRVDVLGTHKKEKFLIERLNDDETKVTVFQNKKGKDQDTIVYQRVFFTNETKELRIYGLNGDDKFDVKGETRKGILVRLIGGLDEDEFDDDSVVKGLSKKTKVYDSAEGNDLSKIGKETRDLTSNVRENNIYNRGDKHYEYDFLVPLPLIGFNPDDGFALGANLLFTHYSFKKDPFAATHLINGQFAFATKAYSLSYTGDYINAIGKADILLDAKIQAPKFVVNFFGFGNNSTYDRDTTDFNYNRIRNSLISVKPAIKKRFVGENGFFTFGPFFERFEVEKTAGRFISITDELPADIFESKYYAGVGLGLTYENINNLQIPTRGIKFYTSIDVSSNLQESQVYSPIKAELTIYQSITPNEKFIYATRIGTQHNIGDFEFFQAPVLGGKTNLRGFRSERFYGRTSFYHNNDLRLKVFSSENGIVPFSFGLHGGFDYGRVWQDGEDSSKWHYGYGGGIWVAPIDFLILAADIFYSKEDERFNFKVGFAF